jgi:hypothetical protein
VIPFIGNLLSLRLEMSKVSMNAAVASAQKRLFSASGADPATIAKRTTRSASKQAPSVGPTVAAATPAPPTPKTPKSAGRQPQANPPQPLPASAAKRSKAAPIPKLPSVTEVSSPSTPLGEDAVVVSSREVANAVRLEQQRKEIFDAAVAKAVADAEAGRVAALGASDRKLKMSVSSAELVPPPWTGKLNIRSDPGKLIVWLAARSRYIEVCRLADFAPLPLNKADTFGPKEVPTLRRWLKMPAGTSLCDDWLSLTPELEAQIIPVLKAKMEVASDDALRAELMALRIPHFSSSWPDLAASFDQFSADWTVAMFKAKRGGVEMPSADLADILKAEVASVQALKHLVAGRCDEFPALLSKVFRFLADEEDLSVRPGASISQRPPTDSRKKEATVSFAPTPPSHKSPGTTPSPNASARMSSASSPSLRVAGVAKAKHSTPPSAKKAVSLMAVGATTPALKLTAGCSNCGLAGHGMESCALHLEFPYPAYGRGPSGVWAAGERSVFFASLPADVKARVLTRARAIVAEKRSRHASSSTPAPTRVSSRTTVNRNVYFSFVARARVAAFESVNVAALADTGTPPNFISPALAEATLARGEGTKVPCDLSIVAAGVHRGDCKWALRTSLWLKFKGVWAAHPVDLLIFETGQPLILGYLSMVQWGWLDLERVVGRFKGSGAERSQAQAWLHAGGVVPSLGIHALEATGSQSLSAVPKAVVRVARPTWHAPRPVRVQAAPVAAPATVAPRPHRTQRRPLLSRALAGAAAMAFVPVHVLPSLAMLFFIAAVGQAVPAVRREAMALGDALPSRYKGAWPALREKREAARRREDAEAGVATGSVLAAAVVHEVQSLADAMPHLHARWRKNAAWQRLRRRPDKTIKMRQTIVESCFIW